MQMEKQKRLLQHYLKWKEKPPTFGALLKAFAPVYVIYLVLGAAAVWLGLETSLPELALLAVGIIVGAIVRDIGFINLSVKNWPVVADILDWEKIKRLSDEAAPDSVLDNSGKGKAKSQWYTVNFKRVAKTAIVASVLFIGAVVGTDQLIRYRYDPVPDNLADRVVVYATKWCPYCSSLRSCLNKSEITYLEKNVNESRQAELEFYALGARGVPVILAGKEVIRGFNREKLTVELNRLGLSFACDAEAKSGKAPASTVDVDVIRFE